MGAPLLQPIPRIVFENVGVLAEVNSGVGYILVCFKKVDKSAESQLFVCNERRREHFGFAATAIPPSAQHKLQPQLEDDWLKLFARPVRIYGRQMPRRIQQCSRIC